MVAVASRVQVPMMGRMPVPRPGRAGDRREAAICALERRQWRKAAHLLQQILKDAPDDLAARSDLGYVLTELGRHQESVVEYRLVAETEPEEPDYQLNLGIALYRVRDFTAAAPFLLRARELYAQRDENDRGILEADVGLVHLYLESDRWEEMEVALRHFLDRRLPDEDFILGLQSIQLQVDTYELSQTLDLHVTEEAGDIICHEDEFTLYGVGSTLREAVAEYSEGFVGLYRSYVSTDEPLAPSGKELAQKLRQWVKGR